ncbi:unnamed protein product [Allacma fusca]|uniref:Uncharacterized protein n=1 Tax=Allacma fusca TaxID=39272 RepID=A0A8J2K2D1_9HEXA|nr:unnamed protein product [Allacma fusca]
MRVGGKMDLGRFSVSKNDHACGIQAHSTMICLGVVGSLIRMQYMFGTSFAGDHNFSLEAVATRYHLCMNKTGKLYTQPTSQLKREKQERRKRRRGSRNETRGKGRKDARDKKERTNKNKKINECIFRLYKFPLNESYYKDAIYSAAYSTNAMGRFIAFGKDGMPRSLKQPFVNLPRHARLGMIIETYTPDFGTLFIVKTNSKEIPSLVCPTFQSSYRRDQSI